MIMCTYMKLFYTYPFPFIIVMVCAFALIVSLMVVGFGMVYRLFCKA